MVNEDAWINAGLFVNGQGAKRFSNAIGPQAPVKSYTSVSGATAVSLLRGDRVWLATRYKDPYGDLSSEQTSFSGFRIGRFLKIRKNGYLNYFILNGEEI